ncbi:N-acetylmuramoyl-L-alanine amidase [Roseinatronobacter bogoriensis]|uniref:N-acetylmuramoyl-L-alanine amidase n=1 Tax=Roseinatronobacter bogoriensis subsp. barguzinensis TaxID=441209 RepID=A0A2K8KDG5_9RHOB|nr:N-acetylmuramoyl-L-alanine amidase [Rhodobaca barguzinensis]MBB4208046.1 N-acetylmuramoyl-L-alanine amidase [Rhodobaca bogoriensis DSM 18756]TDW38686.1 N-acetylmuramoyl-L-alanine amidase [Rhodobaca barguzinensis]TDY69276.1 N-acetylmuramoyl-L-alanine amidase [Rhodobaca bogoriensis DSM 18756]
MRDSDAALDRLCDPTAEVSAHYVISPSGQVWQLVQEADRAWHAGAGSWCGVSDINSHSLGIELVNTGAQPFPEPQMHRLEMLLSSMMDRWNIPPHQVIAHSDMAPERKEDPGPRFDWRRLDRLSLGFCPDGMGDDLPLADSLDAIGYPAVEAEKRLQAFRFRFLPTARGPETVADRRRANAIAIAFRNARSAHLPQRA